jgi:predicted ATPase/class 3 adenylate cyclase
MLFSDVEGSTRLLSRSGHRYAEIQDGHRAVQRATWKRWSGHELATEGDSFFTVFARAHDAVMAALDVQRQLASMRFADGEHVRVRIGVHTGEPMRHGSDYIGMDVHRAARIASAAHGGQIVISAATRDLVLGNLGNDIELTDLGTHRLKDIAEPEQLFQVTSTNDELAADFPPLRSLGATSRLPVPPTALVGRNHELRKLRELLKRPDVRLVTLLGAGGSGKTRLAIALVSSLGLLVDGVHFVSLATETTKQGMWTTIAKALGIGGDAWDPSYLLHTIKDQRALLVLDNVEQIADAAKVVAEIMMAAPRVIVLATSRRALHLRGEHEWPVPPLSIPDTPGLEDAEKSEAVRLFVQHARLGRPTFILSRDNVEAVTAICRRLDGLPLAIELAASRTRLLSPRALLGRLDQASDLRSPDIDRPNRQQTLYSAIEWSYDLLPPMLQRRFRRFGVFAGGCDLDAIAHVVDPDFDTLDLVAELVDVSLLTTTEGRDGEPRIAMLQTITEFARTRLFDVGELEATRRRHGEYYLGLVEEQAEELWTGLRQLAAKDRLVSEYDNIVAALEWAVAARKGGASDPTDTIALRLAGFLWQFWQLTDRITEGRNWLEMVLAESEGQDSRARARALSGAGTLAWRQGDFETATARHAAALTLQKSIGDSNGAAFSMNNLAVQALDQHDHENAKRLLEEARQFSTDRRVTTIVLLNSGEAANKTGDHEQASRFQTEAMRLCIELGDEEIFGYLSLNLGLTSLALNDPHRAMNWFQNGFPRILRLRNSWLLATYLDGLAALALALCEPERAARLFGAAMSVHDQSDADFDVSDSAARDAALAQLRTVVGEEEFSQLLAEGSRMSVDDAVQTVYAVFRSCSADETGVGFQN